MTVVMNQYGYRLLSAHLVKTCSKSEVNKEESVPEVLSETLFITRFSQVNHFYLIIEELDNKSKDKKITIFLCR